jgi:sigma-B regulation protein RsbU (phosphoserine phosphatase)
VLKDFVNSLNKFLIGYTTSDKFASGWFGLYNHNTKTLESINAGHNPTYVFTSNNNFSELLNGGIFLGIYDLGYDIEIIELQKDNVIVFYSDGITEAWNKSKDEFGADRLLDVLKNNLDKKAEHILYSVTDAVADFVGKAEQSDDLTLGVIKIL